MHDPAYTYSQGAEKNSLSLFASLDRLPNTALFHHLLSFAC